MNKMYKWLLGIVLTIAVGVGVVVGLPFKQNNTICWDAPTTNTDGTPLTDLLGYKVYWSATSGLFTDTNSKDIGMATPSGIGACYTITSMPDGLYYMVVTAYNSVRAESAFSNEISKTFSKISRPVTNLR